MDLPRSYSSAKSQYFSAVSLLFKLVNDFQLQESMEECPSKDQAQRRVEPFLLVLSVAHGRCCTSFPLRDSTFRAMPLIAKLLDRCCFLLQSLTEGLGEHEVCLLHLLSVYSLTVLLSLCLKPQVSPPCLCLQNLLHHPRC